MNGTDEQTELRDERRNDSRKETKLYMVRKGGRKRKIKREEMKKRQGRRAKGRLGRLRCPAVEKIVHT